MEKFDPEINIGEIIAGRVEGYPVLEEEPKPKKVRKAKSGVKRKPKKTPPCWIICPHFIVKPPRVVVSIGEPQEEYPFTVKVYAESRKERDEALAHMITCGKEEIETGDKRFWLNGYRHSIQRRGFWEAELKYFFRLRQLPAENLIRR